MLATTLDAQYRARTHDAEDEQVLREAFGSIAAIRLRPLRLPEAGGSFEIWLVFSFFGSAIGSAIIGDVTSTVTKKIGAGLRNFFEHKIRKNQPPEMAVTLSYDDIEVRIPSLSHADIGLLESVGDIVRDHLQSAALRNHKPTVLTIGLAHVDAPSEEWYEPNAGNALDPNRRFWGVSLEGHRQLTHVYDTETRLLSESRVM